MDNNITDSSMLVNSAVSRICAVNLKKIKIFKKFLTI